MTAREKPIKRNWIDPDDAPELTPELAERAQIAIGGKILREAAGTFTKRGRPPIGDEPKQQPEQPERHDERSVKGWRSVEGKRQTENKQRMARGDSFVAAPRHTLCVRP